ncbi:MAG: 1-acyl-sn-glycerol-3-phosphate acyltransferase [Salinivirgaceae bacterium]|nr:1-acyl-sn-glycerol-3-phosphate acyltransferase [Salinivirgaceae bacterium]MDD4745699.1 1-acyl-sn-glycerol-3-phosphate acyltransferase [Salinivirgaceae bacterium]
MTFKQCIGKLLLKITGWKILGFKPKEENFILVVFPHTSYYDFFVGKIFNLYIGFPIYYMIKKEAFIFPFGWLLKASGGVPIDRKKPSATMLQMIERFNDKNQFVLSIAPEGTREKVENWKPGFWYFASKANVPVVPAGMNYKNKTVYFGKPIYMTEDRDADIERVKNVFRNIDLCGKHPDQSQL